MTYSGQVAKVLSVFAVVFVMIIVLHFIMLRIQYHCWNISKRNPFVLLKTMATCLLYSTWYTIIGCNNSGNIATSTKTGASHRVTDFTVPLFATIHLSGSTITIVTCSIGVMLMNGMPIALVHILPFILMLGVMMIAAPGVPGGAVMAAIGLLSYDAWFRSNNGCV